MTVSVAGKPIPLPDALSEAGRLALAFVDGGLEWLAWAVVAPGMRYDFADETELVATVQQGLHASPFTLLPQLGLMVSPVKLLTLAAADLRTLGEAESGDSSAVTAARIRQILASHQLVTGDELAAGVSLLGELGVASAPLFQAVAFDEALALSALVHEPYAPRSAAPAKASSKARPASQASTTAAALSREAAAFAVAQARTVHEYCDYYRLYLDRAGQLGGDATPAQREAAATAAMQALLPVLFGTLDCPQVHTPIGPSEVAAVVREWLARGRMVGFARLSHGVQQIVRRARYDGETGDAAKRIVDAYLQSAQAFLASHRIEHGRMSQDGSTCSFPIDDAQLSAELQLSSQGVISLVDFGTRRPQRADLVPAASSSASPSPSPSQDNP
ncbi:hypothetical protein WT97_06690 [Burkholderia sp. MSMB1459WGS]|uniref:hypothetical protein n=1 Tax=Burkholderia sp. MSMB1459WGS TaxID=1637970 RepID=UPI0007600F55|nr:hypothetical protein [Burkholderia sp. MSMB1459WGS]KWO47756.1 hypothetical protein WT97_06690 [Burkholderia sp. MSMB1459WGS]